jgi:predicted transcriptional regulator
VGFHCTRPSVILSEVAIGEANDNAVEKPALSPVPQVRALSPQARSGNFLGFGALTWGNHLPDPNACTSQSLHVICCIMDKHTVSFRIDADKVTALDALAEALERDRSHLQSWQAEQIKKSLRQANTGKLLPHSRVKQMARKWPEAF